MLPQPTPLDKAITLNINGTTQRLRLCAARAGLPPLLISQGGPGLPLLNDVAKFQKRLDLESSFLVAYWEQRGCGNAARRDTQGVSPASQADDLRHTMRWLAHESGQKIFVLGISLGATFALQAAALESSSVRALVAVSIDTHNGNSDASACDFLQARSVQPGQQALAAQFKKLGPPPYTTIAPFQRRARLLADLGSIEHGRRFGQLLREMLLSLIGTYGIWGAIASLRNMNAIQRRMLPELVTLDLITHWPQISAPVHYLFGERNALVSHPMIQELKRHLSPRDTLATIPDAGHMVHFDVPAAVRSALTFLKSVSAST